MYDDDMTAFQLGYLDGAYDQAHWMGEEKSFDWGGEAWGLYEDYNSGYWDGWNNTQPLPEEYINSSRSWHEWLREDYDIPDDALTINRLFTEYEATIAELRRQIHNLFKVNKELRQDKENLGKLLELVKQKGYRE